MNVCIICFSLNEPFNFFLYYFYIVCVYFCMHVFFLFYFKSPQTILNKQILRKFDTIRFVAPWSIFRNFLGIFYFLNSNLNFKFGPVWYRPKPKPGRTSLTGNRSNRIGSHRFGEPWLWEKEMHCKPRCPRCNRPRNLELLTLKLR